MLTDSSLGTHRSDMLPEEESRERARRFCQRKTTASRTLVLIVALIATSASISLAAQTPPVAVKNLVGWYDASDNSTLTTSASYVSQWTDKSGHGNTLSQSTAASQPYLTTTGGHQGVMFGGSQQLLSSTANTFATGSNPSSMFVVAAFTGTISGGYGDAILYGQNNYLQARGIGKTTGTGNVFATEHSGDVTSTSSWSSTAGVAFASFSPTTESLAVNGNSVLTGSFAPITASTTALYAGSNSYSFWIGPVFEALVYNSVLSTTEQQFIEGYLACKWGLTLPAGHPYKTTCPATSSPSVTVSLAVSPTGIQAPGTDLHYATSFTNPSGTILYGPITVTGPVPANTWYKLSSSTQALGATGLSAAVTYSSDGGVTYTYTPASGSGGAASGYDANVTDVRWTLSGMLGSAASVDSGSVTFSVRII